MAIVEGIRNRAEAIIYDIEKNLTEHKASLDENEVNALRDDLTSLREAMGKDETSAAEITQR